MNVLTVHFCFDLFTGGEQGKDGATVPTLSRTISMPVDIAGEGSLSFSGRVLHINRMYFNCTIWC